MKTLIKLFLSKIYSEHSVKYFSPNDRKWMQYREIYLFGKLWDIDDEPLWT